MDRELPGDGWWLYGREAEEWRQTRRRTREARQGGGQGEAGQACQGAARQGN